MAKRQSGLGLLVAAGALAAAAAALAGSAGSRPAGTEYVSTSRGVDGGVMLLWPRIIPANGAGALRPQAVALRSALRQMMDRALPGRPVEVRPEPQRVCPRAGCRGISVGALLLHESRGCAAVAVIGPPGQTMLRLVPWAGAIKLKATMIPFRDPPESNLAIEDYVPCQDLARELAARSGDVQRALAEVGRLR
ncbi:MAG: hypothetical protein JXR83_18225 [Deltaproteobacteria bacterium]|nr:hypothetical protein [Deltaproteobacteria bacterium]